MSGTALAAGSACEVDTKNRWLAPVRSRCQSGQNARNRFATAGDRVGPPHPIVDLHVGIDTEQVVNGGHQFARMDRIARRIACILIRDAVDMPLFDTAAGQQAEPTLRPMVAAGRSVHTG